MRNQEWHFALISRSNARAFTQPDSRHLIQPELDDGVLTPSDYTRVGEYYASTKYMFLKSPAFWIGPVASFPMGVYNWTRRKRARALLLPASFFIWGSFLVGFDIFQQKIKLQEKLFSQLENPTGVFQATVNARQRAGLPPLLKFSLEVSEQDKIMSTPAPSVSVQMDADKSESSTETETEPSTNSTPTPKGRWDQIRAENSQQGQKSAWDEHREKEAAAMRGRGTGGEDPEFEEQFWDSDPVSSDSQKRWS